MVRQINPLLDTPKNNYICVKLPGLLLEFWTRCTLVEIANAVWLFVYMNPRVLSTHDKRVAWILVEVN